MGLITFTMLVGGFILLIGGAESLVRGASRLALACLPIFFTGQLVARWEGLLFLGYYAAYLLYLVLAATQSHDLQTLDLVMTMVVIPVTVATLLVSLIWTIRVKRVPPRD